MVDSSAAYLAYRIAESLIEANLARQWLVQDRSQVVRSTSNRSACSHFWRRVDGDFDLSLADEGLKLCVGPRFLDRHLEEPQRVVARFTKMYELI